jgi:hypothetical protein
VGVQRATSAQVDAMDNRLKCTLLAASFLTPSTFAQASDSPVGVPLAIHVRTYNHAQVPDNVLVTAKGHATYVLQQSGIELIWIDCPALEDNSDLYSDCQQHPEPADLFLKIIPLPRSFLATPNAFGLALLEESGADAVRAYLFYDPVLKLSTDHRVDASMVLGHVAAHEIGHLLLGFNGHSRSGIMTAGWHGTELKKAAQGRMLFTEEQAEHMRAEVRARNSKAVEAGMIEREIRTGSKMYVKSE